MKEAPQNAAPLSLYITKNNIFCRRRDQPAEIS